MTDRLPKPMSPTQTTAALDRARAQRGALAALQTEVDARALRARERAREANLQDLVYQTAETAQEKKRATVELEAALADLARLEREAREVDAAIDALRAADSEARTLARSEQDAAIARHLRARLPEQREQLMALALDFALLSRAEGRGASAVEALRRQAEASGLNRAVEAQIAARRESILKEIDHG